MSDWVMCNHDVTCNTNTGFDLSWLPLRKDSRAMKQTKNSLHVWLNHGKGLPFWNLLLHPFNVNVLVSYNHQCWNQWTISKQGWHQILDCVLSINLKLLASLFSTLHNPKRKSDICDMKSIHTSMKGMMVLVQYCFLFNSILF